MLHILILLVLQADRLDREAMQRICNSESTSIEILDRIFKEYAHRTAFGYCKPGGSMYTTMTFAAFWERVKVQQLPFLLAWVFLVADLA